MRNRTHQLNTRGISADLAQWARDAARARGLTMPVYLGRLLVMHQAMSIAAHRNTVIHNILANCGVQEVSTTFSKAQMVNLPNTTMSK